MRVEVTKEIKWTVQVIDPIPDKDKLSCILTEIACAVIGEDEEC